MTPRKKKDEEAPPAVEPEATEPEAPEAPVEEDASADNSDLLPLAGLSGALQKAAEALSAHKETGKVSANIDRAIVKIIDAKADIDNELSMF